MQTGLCVLVRTLDEVDIMSTTTYNFCVNINLLRGTDTSSREISNLGLFNFIIGQGWVVLVKDCS